LDLHFEMGDVVDCSGYEVAQSRVPANCRIHDIQIERGFVLEGTPLERDALVL
jgi:hypothetical protein